MRENYRVKENNEGVHQLASHSSYDFFLTPLSAGHMEKADSVFVGFVPPADGIGSLERLDPAAFPRKVVERLRGDFEDAVLSRADDDEARALSPDMLRFVLREDVRGAVDILRELLPALLHGAVGTYHHIVPVRLAPDGDGAERCGIDVRFHGAVLLN